jgi:L-malate glycosyltransferase
MTSAPLDSTHSARRQRNILLVSGFACDTFSSIEMSSIHLSEVCHGIFNIMWLVPTIDNKYNRFADKQTGPKLGAPLFVQELQRRGIPHVQGNISKYNLLKNMILFWTIFKKYNIDAVLTQFGFERFYTTLFAKLFGKKTVWHERWHSLGTRYVIVKKVFYYFFVDCFIAVSNYLASTLPHTKRVYVVHNGMSVKPVPCLGEAERNSLKEKLGLAQFEYVVLMIASFSPGKRHDIALDIAGKIYGNGNNNVGFVFLGSGPLRADYRKEVEQGALRNNVLMPGHKLNIAEYLLASDIVILTSFDEGLPNCLLEGMNFKLPVVTFDTPWAREIIKNGENGFLVPKADTNAFTEAIELLLASKEKRDSMGLKGYDLVINNFDIDIWATKMITVLGEII